MPNTDSPGDDRAKHEKVRAILEEFGNAAKGGDVPRQEAAAGKIWQHIAETQDDEPSPWLQAMNLAHQREAAFDWQGAEAAYRAGVRVAADTPGLQAGAYNHLRSLFLMLDQPAQALAAAQAATSAAREAKLSILLAVKLLSEARCHLTLDDPRSAWVALTEAFAVIGNDPLQMVTRVNALILRAGYHLRHHDSSKAEYDLAAAWKLLQPHLEARFAGGWQSSISSWWSTSARLRAQQGDLTAAAAAWGEAVARSRIVADLPQLEGPFQHNALARNLRDWGKSLEEIRDHSAYEKFEESDSIRRSIGLFPLER